MKHIYIDLDETCINTPYLNNTIKKEEVDFYNNMKYIDRFGKKRRLRCHVHPADGFVIFERPHLQEFLDFLFKYFIVSVYTAASKNYADFIIKNIILRKQHPNRPRRVLYFFYNKHVQFLDKKKERRNGYYSHKHLETLYNTFKLNIQSKIGLQNTFILDNNNHVLVDQHERVFPIPDFKYAHPQKIEYLSMYKNKSDSDDVSYNKWKTKFRKSVSDSQLLTVIKVMKEKFKKSYFQKIKQKKENVFIKNEKSLCSLCHTKLAVVKTILMLPNKIKEIGICLSC